jgi:TolB protein
MDRDGSRRTELAPDARTGVGPVWAPDGDAVYFRARRRWHRADVVTQQVEPIAAMPEGARLARLSPDGSHVAFARAGADGITNVWVADRDGSRQVQVTFDEESASFPLWSPDGEQLAVSLFRGAQTHVGVVSSAGGEPVLQLTEGPGESWAGGWSPGGKRVVFAGRREGVWNVWWVSRAGGAPVRVTDNEAQIDPFLGYPVWSPLGSEIVFERREIRADLWLVDLLPYMP